MLLCNIKNDIIMTKREKRLEKLRRGVSSASYREVERVLMDFGYRLSRVKGSHHIFDGPEGKVVFPVHKKQVAGVYIKLLIKKLNESAGL